MRINFKIKHLKRLRWESLRRLFAELMTSRNSSEGFQKERKEKSDLWRRNSIFDVPLPKSVQVGPRISVLSQSMPFFTPFRLLWRRCFDYTKRAFGYRSHWKLGRVLTNLQCFCSLSAYPSFNSLCWEKRFIARVDPRATVGHSTIVHHWPLIDWTH